MQMVKVVGTSKEWKPYHGVIFESEVIFKCPEGMQDYLLDEVDEESYALSRKDGEKNGFEVLWGGDSTTGGTFGDATFYVKVFVALPYQVDSPQKVPVSDLIWIQFEGPHPGEVPRQLPVPVELA